jgi:hypothetical protein
MSFGFSAVGGREDVIAQLRSVGESTHGSGRLAPELAAVLADAIQASPGPAVSAGHHYAYVVKASGHSGEGACAYLSATIESHHVRKPDSA